MIAAINGVIMSFTKELTTAVKAAPIMTPTARSTTLPRSIKSLNPLIIFLYYLIAHFLAHFLDILLDFLDILLYFVDVLGLLVDGHLYEYRQIYRLERHNGRQHQKHSIESERAKIHRRKTACKYNSMRNNRLERPDPSRYGTSFLFYIEFHGAAIENRTRIESSTSSSVNRYTIAAIHCSVWRLWCNG